MPGGRPLWLVSIRTTKSRPWKASSGRRLAGALGHDGAQRPAAAQPAGYGQTGVVVAALREADAEHQGWDHDSLTSRRRRLCAGSGELSGRSGRRRRAPRDCRARAVSDAFQCRPAYFACSCSRDSVLAGSTTMQPSTGQTSIQRGLS